MSAPTSTPPSQLSLTIAAKVGGHDVSIQALSSGSRRSLTVTSLGDLTLQDALDAVGGLLGCPMPDLSSDIWGGLTKGKILASARLASEGDRTSATLDLSYKDPVQVPGEDLRALFGVLATVDGVTISYDPAAKLQIKARISIDSVEPGGRKVRRREVVGFPLPVPSRSTPPVFRLNYLGLGQRVGPTPSGAEKPGDPLATTFDGLEADLATGDPVAIIGRLARDFYKPDRDWFVAADVSLRGFRVRALFNDPAMYGLEITVAHDPPNFFSGLLFEILYQKLGRGLGVYYGALTLPDSMRRIEIAGAILVLPGFSVWIYTNGDFRLNVGWPLGADSIGIIIGPMVGHAGFTFAKLRSADDPGTGRPSAASGAHPPPAPYNPILQFGLAWDVAVEVDCSAGPLSASLSLSYAAVLQGVIAWKAADSSDPATAPSVAGPPDLYWFSGVASLAILVQGSIDFSVISASVTVRLAAQVSVAYETGCTTVVKVEASVSASLSVHVVFFTIHLSFDMTVSHSFTFGSGPEARLDRPRADGLVFTAVPLPSVSDAPAAGAATDSPLQVPSRPPEAPPQARNALPASQASAAGLAPPPPDALATRVAARSPAFRVLLASAKPVAVEARFTLLPTALFRPGSDPGTSAVVASLVLPCPAPARAPTPPPDPNLTAFERMAAAAFKWLLDEVAPGAPLGDAVLTAQAALGHGSAPPGAPFTGRDDYLDKLDKGLEGALVLRVSGAEAAADGKPLPGAIFPLPPGLAPTFDGDQGPSRLDDLLMAPPDVDALNALYGDRGLGPAASPNGTTPGEPQPLRRLILGDYMLMLLRQMASSVATAGPAAGTAPQDPLAEALAGLDFAMLSGFVSRFTLAGLRLPPPGSGSTVLPETDGLVPLYVATQQQFTLEPGVQAAATLKLSKKPSWIAAGSTGGAETPIRASVELAAPARPAHSWLRDAPPTAVGDVSLRQAPALARVPLAVSLNRQTALQRGGADAGALLPLPARLLALARADEGLALRLTMETGDGGSVQGGGSEGAGADLGEVRAALLLPLAIARVPRPASTAPARGGDAAASTWLPGVYAIAAGLDDAPREMLHGLLAEGGLLGAARLPSARDVRVDLLWSSRASQALTFASEGPGDAALVRTRPAAGQVGGAAPGETLDDCASAGLGEETGKALRLLWEASTGDPAGMLLCDPTALGGREDDAFADGSVATVDILVSTKAAASVGAPLGIPPWADRLLVGKAPTRSVTARARSWSSRASGGPAAAGARDAPLCAPALAVPNGAIGIDTTILAPAPSDDGLPAGGGQAADAIFGLYHLLQSAVVSVPPGNGPLRWGLPASPLDASDSSDPVSRDPNARDAALATWTYHQVVPAAAIGGDAAPYAWIRNETTMRFRLLDVFGNALPETFDAVFKRRYADALITPKQWPGLRLSYRFERHEGGDAKLALEASFSSEGLGLSGSGARAAAAARYDAIVAQLGDPNIAVALSTDLDGGSAKETESGSLKVALQDLARRIKGWLEAETALDFAEGSAAPGDAAAAALLGALGKGSAQSVGAGVTVSLVVTGYGDRPAPLPRVGEGSSLAAHDRAEGPRDGRSASDSVPHDRAGGSLAAHRAAAIRDVLVGGKVCQPEAIALRTGLSQVVGAAAVDVVMTMELIRPVLFSDVMGAGQTSLGYIAPLAVAVVLTRPEELAAPADLALSPEIARAACAVHPHAEPGTGAPESGGPGRRGLAAFAAAFDAAFASLTPAGPGKTRLLLAQRTGAASTAEPGDGPDLWAVRLGDGGLSFEAGAKGVTLALRPLAGQALSRAKPLPDGTPCVDVDLDAAAASCLRAIDAALAPGRAAALARLDPVLHTRLLMAKRQLAETIPLGLAPVLASERATDGAARERGDAARCALESALLTSLGSAATVTAAVCLDVAVDTAGLVGDALDSRTPPVFTGDVGATLSAPGPASSRSEHFFFSSASLPVSGAGSLVLTTLLSLAGPGDDPKPDNGSELVVDLEWSPLLLQHAFEADETFSGYTPSSFLRFAEPGAAPKLRFPGTRIPLPQWFDPEPPRLGAHRAAGVAAGPVPLAPAANAPAIEAAIGAALRWSYTVTLSAALSSEDELWFSPGFGATAVKREPAGVPDGLAALFDAAVTMQSALSHAAEGATGMSIVQAFAALDVHGLETAATTATAAQDPTPEAVALSRFVDLAEELADAWPTAPMASQAAADPPAGWFRLRLDDRGVPTLDRPGSDAASPEDPWPVLAVGAPTGGVGPALDITLAWPSLSLAGHLSADFSCVVRRNAAFGGKAANPAFVLRTPELSFPTSAVPLLAVPGRIAVAPSKDWPLAAILGCLLGALARVGGSVADLALTVACHYAFQRLPALHPGPGEGGLVATRAVLVGTDLAFAADGGAALAEGLAAEVGAWLARARPTRRGASLEFSFTLFGTPVAGGERLALVRLERVSVGVPDGPATPGPEAGRGGGAVGDAR